jgi:hypothetical protein
MTAIKKLDEIMQSGLQFRFFNKPVQDDYLWDIKCFWTHEGVKTSEGFDSCEDCINDCWEYVKTYDVKVQINQV